MKIKLSILAFLVFPALAAASQITPVPELPVQPNFLIKIGHFLDSVFSCGFHRACYDSFGSSVTTINATDLISASRTTINTNFANLNTDKLETTSIDTCSEIASIVSGETGACGSLVLSDGPTFTSLTTLANSSSTQLSAGTNTFYVNSSGKVFAKDTTNGWSGPLSPSRSFVLSTATTTTWTGTTSPAYVPFMVMPFAGTLRQMICEATSTGAFLNVSPYIGTTRPTPSNVVASTTKGVILFTANNTFSANTSIRLYVGTSTADANNLGVACSLTVTET